MFWSDIKEPFRQFRWYIEFFSTEMQEMRYLLKKAAKPTVKISEVQHKYLNHFYYYPGRVEWDPISISFASGKLKDGRLADRVLINALIKSGYVYPEQNGSGDSTQMRTISKRNAVAQLTGNNQKSTVALVQIDSDGNPVERWYLWNPFFTDVKYDSLEYGSEEILNLDCTIKYDYATLNDPEGKSLIGAGR